MVLGVILTIVAFFILSFDYAIAERPYPTVRPEVEDLEIVCERLIEKGKDLEVMKEYGDAVTFFRKAYELCPKNRRSEVEDLLKDAEDSLYGYIEPRDK